MKFLITESKLEKIIFDYLNQSNLFKDVNPHRTGYGKSVQEYFKTVDYEEDMDPDYDHVFTYYGDPEAYEDIVGVESPYSSDYYPLIELDTNYVYERLSSLFTEENVKKYVKDWINQKFNLDAVHLEPN
jgi:hypothetical protein